MAWVVAQHDRSSSKRSTRGAINRSSVRHIKIISFARDADDGRLSATTAQKIFAMVKCVCSLSNESGSAVSGVLRLSQASEDGATTIEGELKGLSPGKHGISVNVYGDLSEGAASCGEIFNPFGKLPQPEPCTA